MSGNGNTVGSDVGSGRSQQRPCSSGRIPYQYFTLRAVPRPDRGERINVGVVLFSEEARALLMAWHVDACRVRTLDPHADVTALTASLRHTEALCSTAPNGDVAAAGMARARRPGALFGWLAAPRSTLVQPGPVHGGLGRDPADELNRLMRRLVLPAE